MRITDGRREWEAVEITHDNYKGLAFMLWGNSTICLDEDFAYPAEVPEISATVGMLKLGGYLVWNEDEGRMMLAEHFHKYFEVIDG